MQFSEDCQRAQIGIPTKKKPLAPIEEEFKKEVSEDE